ncbi:MAG: hypothetical protein Q4A59_06265 [Erysipelotrichaceae bacterium]|nr:hypothetical protein [Erysipelotrichaceae bacterium]
MFDPRYMYLKNENRSLKNEIQKLKSGQKYTDLETKYEKELAKNERKYKATIRENEKSHIEA